MIIELKRKVQREIFINNAVNLGTAGSGRHDRPSNPFPHADPNDILARRLDAVSANQKVGIHPSHDPDTRKRAQTPPYTRDCAKYTRNRLSSRKRSNRIDDTGRAGAAKSEGHVGANRVSIKRVCTRTRYGIQKRAERLRNTVHSPSCTRCTLAGTRGTASMMI